MSSFDRLPEFRMRSSACCGRHRLRIRECPVRCWAIPGMPFTHSTVAEQYAKAQSIRQLVEQNLPVGEALARAIDLALPGKCATQVPQELPLVAAIAEFAHHTQSGIEVHQGLRSVAEFLMGQPRFALHDPFNAPVAQFAGDKQSSRRDFDRLFELPLYEMEHAQIAELRAFAPPVTKPSGQAECLLETGTRLVHVAEIGLQHAEIA